MRLRGVLELDEEVDRDGCDTDVVAHRGGVEGERGQECTLSASGKAVIIFGSKSRCSAKQCRYCFDCDGSNVKYTDNVAPRVLSAR